VRYLLLVVLTACADVRAATLSDGRPFTPPVVYARWYHEVEVCSGIHRDAYERITWYAVPGKEFTTGYEAYAVGYWDDHRIYLAESHLTDSNTVKHEILHELNGPGHPAVFDRCRLR